MDGFLDDYFPSVAAKQATVNTVGNLYCQYDSQVQRCWACAVHTLAAVTVYFGGVHWQLGLTIKNWATYSQLMLCLCSRNPVCRAIQPALEH